MRADPRVALLKELAHPLRLRVIDRLGHLGPASVSALATELGATMPELSNHLRRLRGAGLVRARREGRHAVYELAGKEVDVLLPLLDRLTAPAAPAAGERAVAHLLRPPRRPARGPALPRPERRGSAARSARRWPPPCSTAAGSSGPAAARSG